MFDRFGEFAKFELYQPMSLFISLIVLALGVSGILLLTKTRFPKAEKLLSRIALLSLVVMILCVVLLSNDLCLKGAYTSAIIGVVFLLTTLVLFGLSKRTTTKIWSGLITIPVFICCLLSLFDKGYLFFFYLLALPFAPPIATYDVDETHQVEVHDGGFMACGESLVLTESTCFLFDKQRYAGNNHCVTNIYKVETVAFDENKATFLIHHDESRNIENPYTYETEFN